MKKRASGILCHITSFPSVYGIGDLGPAAYAFADFLSRTKQAVWQVLPLNPIDDAHGNSPYSSISAFAGNPLIISPELMVEDGFLAAEDIRPSFEFLREKVDYPAVKAYKENILDVAYGNFKRGIDRSGYEGFCSANAYWLEDFALFAALKGYYKGKAWSEWPEEIRDREPGVLQDYKIKLGGQCNREKFFQYLFFKQWLRLKDYCRKRAVRIMGDIPIYVNFDSVDVWKNPEIFKLDAEKRPLFVAGVPPDYFSETGQRWGNPVYKWGALKRSGYAWWVQRMKHILDLFDLVRIDHFRGFVAYWEIPAEEETAVNGRWKKAPAEDFFKTMLNAFPHLSIIAEDLGIITSNVKKIMRRFGFPGMKILLFAFGDDNPNHPYLPHTYKENCVVYTGTHDNNTTRGWIDKEATPEEKERLFRYIGKEISVDEIHWELIRLAMASPAKMSIIPMQDILGLDESSRMNRPATRDGNWEWRLLPEQLNQALSEKLRDLTETTGRDKFCTQNT